MTKIGLIIGYWYRRGRFGRRSHHAESFCEAELLAPVVRLEVVGRETGQGPDREHIRNVGGPKQQARRI